jgi:hypothetical protein
LGVSYGVYAHTTTKAIVIGGDVELAYAAEAARALAEEIERVRNGYPEFDADFARARKRVLARALADPIGASARAAQLQRLATDHEPLDQPDRDLEAIRTLDQLLTAERFRRDLTSTRLRTFTA